MTKPGAHAHRDVLLVGSVPLGTAAKVFETASAILGDRIKRIPDGETGERTNWIAWQRAILADNPSLEERCLDPPSPFPIFGLRAGAGHGDVGFGPLGYAKAALASYRDFARLKEQGTIRPGTRFQVSLPTPLAVVAQYIEAPSQAAVEPAYEARLLTEAREIFDAVPHGELALQWDVAVEFAVLEGLRQVEFDDPRQGIVDRLAEACNMVPRDVELGLHLCYGDAGHKHFKEPGDTALLVDIANAVSARLTRDIDWIHMPVPRGRDDDAYYAPLRGLALRPETELYLGLIHDTDGVEGARRRIAAAETAVGDFGVATECGFGRRPTETIPDLLGIHIEAGNPGVAE